MRVDSIGGIEPATAAPAVVTAADAIVGGAEPPAATVIPLPQSLPPEESAAPIVSLGFADGESVALAEDDPRVGSFRAAAAAVLGDAAAAGPS
jgi:hypothetical protein